MVFLFKSSLITLIVLFMGSTSQAGIIFFTHLSVIDKPIDAELIKKIYYKKIKYWKDGSKIRPLDHFVGTEDRNAFISQWLQRSEIDLTEYWIQEKQQSGSVQPTQVLTREMVIYLVETIPGSIGYISDSEKNRTLLTKRKVKLVEL